MKSLLYIINSIFVLPIRLYQWTISPMLTSFFGSSCIYHPSCSNYAVDAVMKFGPLKGFVLGILRIVRCNGMFIGGEDSVHEHLTLREAIGKYGEHWRYSKDNRDS